MTAGTPPLPESFWRRVVAGPDGCWVWAGALTGAGYAQLSDRLTHPTRLAHLAAYERLVGPIPEGMQLDHTCHTRDVSCSGGKCLHRRCVNPAHLEPVTRRVNLLRGRSPAARAAVAETCSEGHPFDAVKADGTRDCTVCSRAANRRWHATNRDEHNALRRARYAARKAQP